jgi:hypothetical protein
LLAALGKVPGGQTHWPAAFITFGGGQTHLPSAFIVRGGGQMHWPFGPITLGGGQMQRPAAFMIIGGGQTHWPAAFITFGGGHFFGGTQPTAAVVGGQTQAPVVGLSTSGGLHCTWASIMPSNETLCGTGEMAGFADATVQSPARARHIAIHFMWSSQIAPSGVDNSEIGQAEH